MIGGEKYMFNKIVRGSLTLAGASAGYAISMLLIRLGSVQELIELPMITPIMELVINGIGEIGRASCRERV